MPSNVRERLTVEPARGEPWGRRLWVALAVVVLIGGALESYGINKWPMADDETGSLIELGLLHVNAESLYSSPPSQIAKLPKATPVWNAFQRTAIGLLPNGELSYRLPSLACAMLTSALMFLLAARWRGLWFGTAVAIVQHGTQLFIYLSQLNRFYMLALLLLTLAVSAMWWPRRGVLPIVATAALTVLTVLSHNVTVAVFVLAFCAACPAYLLRQVSAQFVLRSGMAAIISVLLYVLYLLPIVRGWGGTGNPTPVLVSFAAHAGVPALALAILGVWLSLTRLRSGDSMLWWVLMVAGSLCVFELAPVSWSPRYFLFFLPAVWFLAAHAMEFVAARVSFGSVAAVWYACVSVLFLPSILSHYQDGSRHDYRQAMAVVLKHVQPGEPILSDDGETVVYYLPENLRPFLKTRTRVTEYPVSEFFFVCRSNVWMPLPSIPDRQMELLAEISHRRFDQFSHVLRVYRVAAIERH